MKYKTQILELRKQGKSYKQIVKILGCTISLVCYHCGKGQKEKHLTRARKRHSKLHPFQKKMECFIYRQTKMKKNNCKSNLQKQFRDKIYDFKKRCQMSQEFTLEDIINKIGENPICYLTGEQIDINKPSSYQFDHIIPISRGGDNSLDNLGIVTKTANRCKTDMTPDELFFFCKKILEHNGYQVNKREEGN